MAPHDYYPSEPDGMRVITLASSTTPMPLHVPFVHEIEGFTVFRSQSEVGDSTLYYLHVGYFANDAVAREALLVIRKYFPFAMIEPVPDAAMGSLDDTMTAEFRVLREATAHVVARREIAHHAVAVKPTQYFAVLLQRRESPGDATSISRLREFRGFHVYGVRASHDGGECQDIRLGFFRDLPRARAFVDAIRTHFPKAAVLPVSKREHARVTGLVQQSSPVVHSTRGEAAKPVTEAAESPSLEPRTTARG